MDRVTGFCLEHSSQVLTISQNIEGSVDLSSVKSQSRPLDFSLSFWFQGTADAGQALFEIKATDILTVAFTSLAQFTVTHSSGQNIRQTE